MQHPQRLGKYPITGVLGQGAMGVVYKAHDPVIDRPVAIKTIQRSLVSDDVAGEDIAARFRNEARAVGRLSHPGIVSIYEYGEDGDAAFIAMEFVDGQSLDRVLRAGSALPEAEVLSLMEQLLDALDCAHQAGVWHRDIKPANLLMTPQGQVKLTDFGIARIASLALTRVAAAIGTPGYMAPEQYTGVEISHRVDLFAAGVLLYRLLTGSMPFSGSPESVMYKILHEQPLPPSQVAAGRCPPFYDALVLQALSKKPEDRPASAAAFRQALRERGVEPARTVLMPLADDATVLLPRGGDWTTGVHAEAVADMERQLATVMGPIAKAIVRQAARTCSDVNSLRDAVAQHIPDPREREQFVSAATPRSQSGAARSQARPTAAPTTALSQASATGAGSAAGVALAESSIADAIPRLSAVVGVIAKVIVKKAAAKARNRGEFVALLIEAVDAEDQQRVRDALRDLR